MTPYVGATKRITLAEARELDPRRWAIQQKVDGMFVRLYLDTQGRVARAFARSGAEVGRRTLGRLLGARLGWPSAELVGELEAHTEAGVQAAAARGGQPLVHLFDCLHDGARSLTRLPYRERRDALWRMRAELDERAPSLRRSRSGRFAAAGGTALAPILEQAPLGQLERAWEAVKAHDLEGLVLVALDAPAGARASKLKLKPVETLDVEAVSVSRTTVTCAFRGSYFTVGRGRHEVAVGDLVEVRHAGWYGAGQVPRFPALVRVRRDLLI